MQNGKARFRSITEERGGGLKEVAWFNKQTVIGMSCYWKGIPNQTCRLFQSMSDEYAFVFDSNKKFTFYKNYIFLKLSNALRRNDDDKEFKISKLQLFLTLAKFCRFPSLKHSS